MKTARISVSIILAASLPAYAQETPSAVAVSATKEQPFVNSLGMKFVPVPGTNALFCIHETRKVDYRAYAEANSGVDESWKEVGYSGFPVSAGEDHPVVMVSWDDAKEFCAWLSEKEGRQYRLPTDHEWSCAVGIGDRENPNARPGGKSEKLEKIYPWGAVWPPPPGAGNFADLSLRTKVPLSKAEIIQGYDDGFATTSPVMAFAPNKLGLHDMGGNVWQWCLDRIADPVQELQRVFLPGGQRDRDSRVRRGSSYLDSLPWAPVPLSMASLLSSSRSPATPTSREINVGFRCVLVPSAQATLFNASREEPFTNTLGMEFVPAGTHGELMSVYDTRVSDFTTFVNETKYDAVGESGNGTRAFTLETTANGPDFVQVGASWNDLHFQQTPNHPVVCVSFFDALAFCEWLTARERGAGRLPANLVYRLPSDEEWRRACGTRQFPWGDQWPPGQEDGNYCGVEALTGPLQQLEFNRDLLKVQYRDGYPRTAPVGSFMPNAFGLCDMGGNVWQWCATRYRAAMNSEEALKAMPHLNNEGDDEDPLVVARGGSWLSFRPIELRSAFRSREDRRYRADTHGFRCVIAPAQAR